MKFSPVIRLSARRVWISVLTCSLSSSGRSREQMMILLSISGRKCLGAFMSRTPVTASVRFLLLKYCAMIASCGRLTVHKPSVTSQRYLHVCCEEQEQALLTVIFSSSSLAGGGFLFVF